jgi:hypothetical protein
MLLNTIESRSQASESRLEILGYDDKDKAFIAKSPKGNTLKISDTFAEMYRDNETRSSVLSKAPFFSRPSTISAGGELDWLKRTFETLWLTGG